jgi:hypothetical protein
VDCLKAGVWRVLEIVAAEVGRLEITSGCDGKHAPRSFHYSGQAVDFRPLDASQEAVVAVLQRLPEVGGIGTYARKLVHADIGARKFAWHGQERSRARSVKGRAVAAIWPVALGLDRNSLSSPLPPEDAGAAAQ